MFEASFFFNSYCHLFVHKETFIKLSVLNLSLFIHCFLQYVSISEMNKYLNLCCFLKPAKLSQCFPPFLYISVVSLTLNSFSRTIYGCILITENVQLRHLKRYPKLAYLTIKPSKPIWIKTIHLLLRKSIKFLVIIRHTENYRNALEMRPLKYLALTPSALFKMPHPA